ncbi:MAG TPA: M14 family zinc carboxypeptidase [Jiangellaceae bacterium]|nr:M14 family zinc carboxypeptidase [Jiangellaceae bacterium]
MRTLRRRSVAVLSAIAMIGTAAVAVLPAGAQSDGPQGQSGLEVYVGEVDAAGVEKMRALGLDADDFVVDAGEAGTTEVEAVLTDTQAAKLQAQGVELEVKMVDGKKASEVLLAQAEQGWEAFRSYSEDGGIRDEIMATAAENETLTEVVDVGSTVEGQEILALRVTANAADVERGDRPAVLYAGAQHAREWITPEMVRRLMHYVLDNYGSDAEITDLVNTTELWFLPVANPDGYDFTFTEDHRLWRKNTRDNNDDGTITIGDGIDLNRNFAVKWGYDNEGSSPDPASDTYRGPSANSEPETQALDNLFADVGFEFFINYHSAANLLLYGIGWQVGTPSPDDVIYEAMVGTDKNPAVPTYDPDLSAELYTTNGDTDTHAQVEYGTLGFTPEMSTCEAASDRHPSDEWDAATCVSEFVFPDDEELIQEEFEMNLPFALAVAQSSLDPDDPVVPSTVPGTDAPDLVSDPFTVSYGTSQQVAVTAKRSLQNVQLNYSINGGAAVATGVEEWEGGERYGETHDVYYGEFRGTIEAQPGDEVEVWFTGANPGGGQDAAVRTAPFTYTVHDDIGSDVLILAVEDTTGISPVQGVRSAKYADEHASALAAAGYSSDVYDFDTMGRLAPHHLGVLSHYEAVVWETGDDSLLRSRGQVPGTTAKAAFDIEVSVRDYLNEGGKLVLGGKNALMGQRDGYVYNPTAPPECTNPDDLACFPLSNDFMQYWLGTYVNVDNGGVDSEGEPFMLTGAEDPFTGFTGDLNAAGSAQNQSVPPGGLGPDLLLTTSSFLPVDEFPLFASEAPLDWDIPGGPFDPRTGEWYVYSQQADAAYKRFSTVVDLTNATTGELRFWSSYDTEVNWDYLFVEAHPVGTDDWTTLPDALGHTQEGTGDSCPEGWDELHPFINHYQGPNCEPAGSTGEWHAATGTSNGWSEWSVDLSAYEGQQVEVSISYVTDWATQGIGVFLDDVSVLVDGTAVAETSFETDLGVWTVAGSPEGSANNVNDWIRTQLGFEEGAAVTTEDAVYFGFGLEGLAPAERNDLVARTMSHLFD